MAKYSVPGIRFQEIDNTVRTESEAGMGVGAIVMKSNKGPVNQRIVTKNYGEFTEIFGEPETLTDYGHFAAENYFANSTQLFAVRCTMGDEQYAQIQYCYPNAPISAVNKAENTYVIKYVDNQEDYQLNLIQPLSAIIDTDALKVADWADQKSPYYLAQSAKYAEFSDIFSESTDTVVFKAWNHGKDPAHNTDVLKGMHIRYPAITDAAGNMSDFQKIILTDDAWCNCSADANQIDTEVSRTFTAPDGKTYDVTKVTVSVPPEHTLNKSFANITFYAHTSAVEDWSTDGVAYSGIFTKTDGLFYDPTNSLSGEWEDRILPPEFGGSNDFYGYTSAYKVNIMDWEDPDTSKQYYINSIPFNDAYEKQDAFTLTYTDFINADESHAIFCKADLNGLDKGDEDYFASAVSAMYMSESPVYDWLDNRTPRQVINDMIDEYGINDIGEINQYTYLRYKAVLPEETIIEKIVKETDDILKDPNHKSSNLFYKIADKSKDTTQTLAVYHAETPESVVVPIQANWKSEKNDIVLNNIVATPTSYLVNSVDKTYADGYTILTQSEDEPGNGDIERYTSVFDNQLIIASIGPGEYGNDIGISIITTECANIKALQHQNAFNWKYSYDDEDQVNKNAEGLTWKKVFRINVYIKNKTQTALGAWGTGMNALLKDPVESWFVSTDPLAKDSEGNSLYAPTVINGHSDYIYISRSSISNALDACGKYNQPKQTYSIYGLTGGKNSTKNNMVEKTAALNFYSDRQKAKFDILFNVDAVDTFNGRQRYNAHQRKIAEIAATRTMDIGVVQVTSKSAKTCKQMISEAKMFSFNNGSYVAEYAGYDKYYNATLAAWIYLPKSVAGACAMAYCDTFAYPWMAPAGVTRGTISYTTGQLLRLTDDEIGQLYDNNVNSTRDCGGYGTILWGQKTALKKNSLLNRINIRRCLNYIEKQLENMMTPYLFMQNSINTRSSARNDIDSFLQRVQAAEGIESYDLSVTQDPEDPTIMNVNISLVPTSAIEFIDVKVVINRNRGVAVIEG